MDETARTTRKLASAKVIKITFIKEGSSSWTRVPASLACCVREQCISCGGSPSASADSQVWYMRGHARLFTKLKTTGKLLLTNAQSRIALATSLKLSTVQNV